MEQSPTRGFGCIPTTFTGEQPREPLQFSIPIEEYGRVLRENRALEIERNEIAGKLTQQTVRANELQAQLTHFTSACLDLNGKLAYEKTHSENLEKRIGQLYAELVETVGKLGEAELENAALKLDITQWARCAMKRA